MPTKGLIVATSGTPDETGVFLDGKICHGLYSISSHFKSSSPITKTMMKFVGSPHFGDEIPYEDILKRYSLVYVVGQRMGQERLFYNNQLLGFIEELYFGMSSHYGVTVEMNVAESVVSEYKERFKEIPWITFDAIDAVEFTNA